MIRGAVGRAARRVLVAGAIALVAVAATGGAARAATVAPYSDPNATGYIGLCDQAGHQVTSGSTTAAPFAWLAVSTMPAPAPYDNASRTAILLAYQPRNGLAPGEWSGAELTASSRYTNPNVPMAAATAGDDSLADFMDNYHPVWDGFLQLRMYFGAADKPQYSLHYPALDIQVQGDTWQAVGGGPVNCTAGTAESIESIVLPATTTTPTSSAGAGSQSSGATGSGSDSAPATSSSATASGGAPTPTSGGGGATATPVTATQSGSSSGWVVTALVVILVVAAAWFLVRRRRPGARGGAPDPGTGDPGTGDVGTSGSGPASTDPVGRDSSGPDPVGPDSSGPDPVGPDSSGPDPVGPDAADQPSHRSDQIVTSSTSPSSSSSGTSRKGQHP